MLLAETALEVPPPEEPERRVAVVLDEEDRVVPLFAELLLFLRRVAGVAFAAGFLVVFGLLFDEAFLETFLAVEDVPLCAILITPYRTILQQIEKD